MLLLGYPKRQEHFLGIPVAGNLAPLQWSLNLGFHVTEHTESPRLDSLIL